jgi:GTPase
MSTWLFAVRVLLGQLVDYSLEFLVVTACDGPFEVGWEMCSNPFCYELPGVAGCSEKDQLVFAFKEV